MQQVNDFYSRVNPETGKRQKSKKGNHLKRVAFFSLPHHWPIVRPVYEIAQKKFDCWASDQEKEVIDFKPHAVVAASACPKSIRKSMPESYVIWLRHGFSDKNYAKVSLGRTDFACVSSQWAIDDFTAKGYKPFLGYWITGFSAMDQVYHRIAALSSQPKKEKGLSVLYAPTYNPELSAQEQLGEGWIENFTFMFKDFNLLIKPHPLTQNFSPEHIRYYKKMAITFPRVKILDPNSDFYEVIDKADMLISDASSVIFYYLALDRPVILVDNEKRFECKNFNPNGPEWSWREIGERVSTQQDLLRAVKEAVEAPQKGSSLRSKYRSKVLGDTFDGRACERIVSNIQQLLSPSPPPDILSRTMRCKKMLHPLRIKKTIRPLLPKVI
ncbi:MAG: CDP-glycerol glycerophosphotransferase family protein [Syntrophotaleaceae bacterium]